MKRFLRALFCVLAFVSVSAQATIFDFSFTFNSGTSITGSLSGNLIGDYVHDLSDIKVYKDGNELSSTPLYALAHISADHSWSDTVEAIVSPIESLNNFMFVTVDSTIFTADTNYFLIINDTNGRSAETSLDFAHEYEYPRNASWSLVAREEVPEPASLGLLALGLIAIGCTRKQKATIESCGTVGWANASPAQHSPPVQPLPRAATER